jgi:DNA-binding response OmpR family regulator
VIASVVHASPARQRSSGWPHLSVVPKSDVVVEAWARAVYKGQNPVDLTRREFDLLLFLAEHPRHVFTRSQLLTRVWGHLHTGERTVDVHVRRLRAKLGTGLITTLRGIGYRLADSASVHIEAVPQV